MDFIKKLFGGNPSYSKIKKVKLLISEPWDFHKYVDKDRLIGTIKGRVYSKQYKNPQLLVILDNPLLWNGIKITQLIVASRVMGKTIDDILTGKDLWSCIFYVKEGIIIKPEEEYDSADTVYSFIGSVKPVKE